MLHYEVRVAYDGFAALEQIPQFHPELVLLDLGMPGLDGLETARRILDVQLDSHPALVALSGWGQEEDRRKTREAGFAGHLLKPVELRVLRSMISELLP
jgi:CheY-like chemotaxis protein